MGQDQQPKHPGHQEGAQRDIDSVRRAFSLWSMAPGYRKVAAAYRGLIWSVFRGDHNPPGGVQVGDYPVAAGAAYDWLLAGP